MSAERLQAALERLSGRTSRALVGIWDRVDPWDLEASLRWHAAAAPVARGVALASVDLTVAFAATLVDDPPAPSALIVDAAAARVWEPFDRLARLLAEGRAWEEATRSGRKEVAVLGRDTVMGPARAALADTLPGGPCVRRLDSDPCEWCMSLAGVVFPSAADADFGHPKCGCIPVPVGDDARTHNETIRRSQGFDTEAEAQWGRRQHRARIVESEQTALRRSAEARAELAVETDPARRERLSIREQEWETRAEFAAERLRILDTGTHQL